MTLIPIRDGQLAPSYERELPPHYARQCGWIIPEHQEALREKYEMTMAEEQYRKEDEQCEHVDPGYAVQDVVIPPEKSEWEQFDQTHAEEEDEEVQVREEDEGWMLVESRAQSEAETRAKALGAPRPKSLDNYTAQTRYYVSNPFDTPRSTISGGYPDSNSFSGPEAIYHHDRAWKRLHGIPVEMDIQEEICTHTRTGTLPTATGYAFVMVSPDEHGGLVEKYSRPAIPINRGSGESQSLRLIHPSHGLRFF